MTAKMICLAGRPSMGIHSMVGELQNDCFFLPSFSFCFGLSFFFFLIVVLSLARACHFPVINISLSEADTRRRKGEKMQDKMLGNLKVTKRLQEVTAPGQKIV